MWIRKCIRASSEIGVRSKWVRLQFSVKYCFSAKAAHILGKQAQWSVKGNGNSQPQACITFHLDAACGFSCCLRAVASKRLVHSLSLTYKYLLSEFMSTHDVQAEAKYTVYAEPIVHIRPSYTIYCSQMRN